MSEASNKVFKLGKWWYFTNDDVSDFDATWLVITLKDHPKGDWELLFPLDCEGPFSSKKDAEAALTIRHEVR
jgi:hypothetical protein